MIWLLKEYHEAILNKLGDVDAEEFMRFLKLVDLYARLETLRVVLHIIGQAKKKGISLERLEYIIGDMISDFDSEIEAELLNIPIFEHYYRQVKESSNKKEVPQIVST